MKINKEIVQKTLISFFILTNSIAILSSNWPTWLHRKISRDIPEKITPILQKVMGNKGYYYLRMYAYQSGLDNVWQMFSYMYRDDWKLVLYGRNAQGEKINLPLPLQSERTWFEHNMADIKEAKFLLNIFGQKDMQQSYMSYLCKQFESLNLKKIELYNESIPINNREYALENSQAYQDKKNITFFGERACF